MKLVQLGLNLAAYTSTKLVTSANLMQHFKSQYMKNGDVHDDRWLYRMTGLKPYWCSFIGVVA